MKKVEMVSPNRLEYKGYAGNVIYDLKNNVYFGKIIEPALQGEHSYEGKTIYDLKESFSEAVDRHIDNQQ